MGGNEIGELSNPPFQLFSLSAGGMRSMQVRSAGQYPAFVPCAQEATTAEAGYLLGILFNKWWGQLQE